MAEFKNHKDVERWLEALPKDLHAASSYVLSARVALRVVPLLEGLIFRSKIGQITRGDRTKILLPVFRALALAWGSAKFDNKAISVYTGSASRDAFVSDGNGADAIFAGRAASDAAIGNLISASAYASGAVYASTAQLPTSAEEKRRNADAGRSAATDQIWQTISTDATDLESGTFFQHLARSSVWRNGEPDWAKDKWRQLKSALTRTDDPELVKENWQVWIDWYEARRDGLEPWPEEVEIACALIPDAIWKQGPAAANAEIKRIRDDWAARSAPSRWDYFISYSSHDEAMAREVSQILNEAGHSTFAQFKDIPTGSNLVNEMQRGLADSGRMIALYSPEYQESAHCQAEWSAAYNADPSGAQRKLVPLLLRPTKLPPLARQIVFKSLVGLEDQTRKQAVLDAIAASPALSVEEIKQRLAQAASPQPHLNAQEQLDVRPNPVFDQRRADNDLRQLPATQRGVIDAVLDSLPENAPKVIRASFNGYQKHLRRHGVNAYVGLLTNLASAIEKEFKATGDVWGDGLASLFESFFENHALFKTHFPLESEEILADTPVREDEAVGDAVTRPADIVAVAFAPLEDENKATAELGEIIRGTQERAADVAAMGPDLTPPDPNSRRVSYKRRWVLGTLGFFVALYNFVGSTASIVSTPTGAAFYKALGDAIQLLTKLLI